MSAWKVERVNCHGRRRSRVRRTRFHRERPVDMGHCGARLLGSNGFYVDGGRTWDWSTLSVSPRRRLAEHGPPRGKAGCHRATTATEVFASRPTRATRPNPHRDASTRRDCVDCRAWMVCNPNTPEGCHPAKWRTNDLRSDHPRTLAVASPNRVHRRKPTRLHHQSV
jgi:hypothetical protein